MKHLASINKYFWKYKWLFLLGIIFIILSNYFRILSPQITKYVLNTVEVNMQPAKSQSSKGVLTTNNHDRIQTSNLKKRVNKSNYDPLVQRLIVNQFEYASLSFKNKIIICGTILLVLAL